MVWSCLQRAHAELRAVERRDWLDGAHQGLVQAGEPPLELALTLARRPQDAGRRRQRGLAVRQTLQRVRQSRSHSL